MGLFSYVKLEMNCPFCGHLLKEFQSKDGILMEENEPWTLNNFYTSCENCKKWVEYIRKGTELSSIDLISEGHTAVRLLKTFKHLNELKEKGEFNDNLLSIALDFADELNNFLKINHYPVDNNNWLDWYELKK